jgi:glycosyltransferase involved in cell wall biosynthesis
MTCSNDLSALCPPGRSMTSRYLTALPVYNEAAFIYEVLDEVRRFSDEVLVVNDGSTDGSAELLSARDDVRVVTHESNRGYGAALSTAFDYADRHGFEMVVTIDCDGQHEPQRIPQFVAACHELHRNDDEFNDEECNDRASNDVTSNGVASNGVNRDRVDIVSGSRYLRQYDSDSVAPVERRRINMQVTRELNQRFNLELTDAFCGFKAYRVSALRKLQLTEVGYAMPLELWVQAAHVGLNIIELPVPLIYLDEERSFGGMLDTPDVRLEYYHLVLDRAEAALRRLGNLTCAGRVCGDTSG